MEARGAPGAVPVLRTHLAVGPSGRDTPVTARPALAVTLAGVTAAALALGLKGAGLDFGSVSAFSLAAAQVVIPLCAALWLFKRSIVPASSGEVGTVPTETIGDAVTWHDAFGDVLRASATAQHVFGAGPGALAGGGLLARVQVADRPAVLKALSDAAHGPQPVVVVFRIVKELGGSEIAAETAREVVWAEMRAHRLDQPDSDRDAAAVIAFTRDITLQKRHAEGIESARLEAERANELKGRFLATVTHELRTPLNAIIGFSELLSADHPFLITEERRKEYAEIIKNSGHHLLEIVNTLLDMSKIESGSFNFDPERFSFGALAAGACDLMQLRADQADVALKRDFAADLPEITADRRACRQILLNLVSNAVKFTPAGGVVTVSLTQIADALVLRVADTGVGVPEKDLSRLGDPFFQSGAMHSRAHEGTGLGLSVVRGLVGLHGGRLLIESGIGLGTAVTVTLPLRAEAETGRTKPVVIQIRPRVAARRPERMSA